ncbi:Piso0_004241 [Millerozyma farinosa CBS 7064]|uniref:Piso0_004241 protein n=1 Tax=Pichia sorbitophila (strain ATCC MYA-4447 / BCRC 22081 / CBS 7064 / NBRC 10061 / NRRL Y-12695) TaxID=559304 RepID=G8Y7V7_PICSO|nr:Piso0_004241 [Millerozyma farinosa CBS 7064]CCE84687.1 Piso0_004241 [Millerozyma farinosa CBS 7064]
MGRHEKIALLTFLCIFAGCINSLAMKYQDNQCVKNCDSKSEKKHKLFDQPSLQTLQMFLGEMLCFLVYRFSRYWARAKQDAESEYVSLGGMDTSENQILNKAQVIIPSLCDSLATAMMCLGLVYTPVSLYQMSRGAIVLFVALLSVIFLKHKITKLQWISLSIVAIGVALLGYSGSSHSQEPDAPPGSTNRVTVGIIFILLGQISQAVQYVVEERLMSSQSIVPLRLVYLEGFWGSLIVLGSMTTMHLIFGAVDSSSEFEVSPFNMVEAFKQYFHSQNVMFASVIIMFSIAVFNFSGISLTSELSATSRSTIDTSRTLLVWLFAIYFGWEAFYFSQLLGFVTLVFGTLSFNGVIEPENWTIIPARLKSKRSGFLDQNV